MASKTEPVKESINKNKEIALKTALAQIEKNFGKGAIMKLGFVAPTVSGAIPMSGTTTGVSAAPLHFSFFTLLIGRILARFFFGALAPKTKTLRGFVLTEGSGHLFYIKVEWDSIPQKTGTI